MTKVRTGRTGLRVGIAAAIGVVIVGGAFTASAYIQNQQQDAKFKKDLAIADVNAHAPNFTLTDQHGAPFTLSDAKGKGVVLMFMDPECTDICPIISAEVVQANKHLGTVAKNVEFVAVNVNQYHGSMTDLTTYSHAHGLDKLPNWHFVTGATSDLQAVWKSYGVYVKPTKTGDVQHSDYIIFIDKSGNERYIAMPQNNNPPINIWGQGIAYFANKVM